MKILVVHNRYQQLGGEDTTVQQEIQLLRDNGNTVIEYRRTNEEVLTFGKQQKATLPLHFIWARDTYQQLSQLIRQSRPDVAHFHNLHFMISPSAYYACQDLDLPVVQTVQNYRLFCPSANFLRNNRPCEDCMDKFFPWPGILHSCYRDSKIQTGMVGMVLASHRLLGTWRSKVDRYILPTEFVRQKFIAGGFSADKLVVKPNFVYPEPAQGEGKGNYALFVGRLAPEKGIDVLLSAWKQLGGVLPLKIVGDGPLHNRIADEALSSTSIEWLGQLSKDQVLALMKEATVLIFPSIWYEAFPLVIVEAYACGLPVIASDLGSMTSLIEPFRTGLHFEPGNADDLAGQIRWLLAHPQETQHMRQEARSVFEGRYTAPRNYEMLTDIYNAVKL